MHSKGGRGPLAMGAPAGTPRVSMTPAPSVRRHCPLRAASPRTGPACDGFPPGLSSDLTAADIVKLSRLCLRPPRAVLLEGSSDTALISDAGREEDSPPG